MEESYECDKECSSSTSAPIQSNLVASATSSPFPPDEISLFLHQILRPSYSLSPIIASSFSSFSSPPPSFLAGISCNSMPLMDYPLPSFPLASERQLSAVDLSDIINQSSSGLMLDLKNVSSCEDYDCESEEGLVGLVEQVSAKPLPRTTSKRSRAAEVHNFSEKRRRSRINEKLKALQNLIPNSSKTDKGSMLDEAIEYLKQLLLQVQMLVIRNGFNMEPTSLPISHNQISSGEDDSSVHLNMGNTPSLQLGRAFHLQKSSKEIYREKKLKHEKIDTDHLGESLPFSTVDSSSESPFS